MNRKLAKQLKDSGFPQRFLNGKFYAEKGLTHKDVQRVQSFFYERLFREDESKLDVGDCIAIPILSELIEGCEQWSFQLQDYGGGKFKWGAISQSYEIGFTIGYGESPEEAVARLWLELNKK